MLILLVEYIAIIMYNIFNTQFFILCTIYGVIMNKIEIVDRVIKSRGGIAKTDDFVANGLSNKDVADLCKKGRIDRIRQGYYKIADDISVKEERMIVSLLPECIICVESALFYYGYTDFTPREWSIAVPRTFSRSKLDIDALSIKVYYIQPTLFELGKTRIELNDVVLNIYDRERTICDCFKYRNKIDSEMFNKAVKAYAKDNKKDLNKLSLYATKMKVYNNLMNVMEVLIND